MGLTLAELGRRMSAAEFGLHMQLEVMRSAKPEARDDPYLVEAFGG